MWKNAKTTCATPSTCGFEHKEQHVVIIRPASPLRNGTSLDFILIPVRIHVVHV